MRGNHVLGGVETCHRRRKLLKAKYLYGVTQTEKWDLYNNLFI